MSQRKLSFGMGLLVWASAGSILSAAEKSSAQPAIEFNRDIRPILSENCFACHGPDEKERKAKLRFDRQDEAFKPAKSGDMAIVPGDTAKSKLVERIITHDPDEVMPPPKTGKKLTAPQIDLLTRWIAEGAKWQGHWAFVKPERPAIPQVEKKDWPRNELDYLVLAKLEKEGLHPSPEADPTTLVRRATLDLTGLPPTIAEVDAFLSDKSGQAYDKLVDRLLSSQRYGEQMARYWLDAARYADSHGYHIDSERGIWKWRDWVAGAFNRNLSFDQFTIEQLAGDLLPEASLDQKIASGYVRCNMSTGEGGAIEEDYLAKYTFDRMETTSTIWLGLTMTCARCHAHKYDPISQREYYGMYSLFNNLNEPVMDGNKPNPDPFLKVPTAEQAKRQEWLRKKLKDGQAKIDGPAPELDAAQTAWETKWHDKLKASWTVLAPGRIRSTVVVTNGPQFKTLEDHSILAEGTNTESDIFEVTLKAGPGTIAAFRLEALPHDSLPKKGSARAEDGRFRLSEFEAEWIAPPDKDGKAGPPTKLKFSQALADASEEKFEIGKAIDGKPETGWGVNAASVTEPHTAVFFLADPLKLGQESELRIRLQFQASKSRRAIGHFRLGTAQNEELVALFNPPKTEPWQVIGPFKSGGLEAGFTNVFAPEKEIDLKKSFPGVRDDVKWNAQPDFADGKANLLVSDLHGVHGVFYLYRTITVPTSRKAEFSLKADDLFKFWVNGQAVAEKGPAEKKGPSLTKVAVELKPGENKLLFKVVNHQGAAYFTFDKDLGERDSVPPEVATILATTKKPVSGQLTTVRNHYRRSFSPEFKQLFESMGKWREEDGGIERAIPITLIAREMDKPRDTFMLMRGEYDKKGDKVAPGAPSILPPWPKNSPTNRLGLARWLVDPSHPLTARVNVNRFWQQYFGIGLVKTTEDFGAQGERPPNPDLLDWLATEFIRSGWDVKQLQKLIVNSATYRQSAKVPPELFTKDPENRLLARGPRFRLDAEVLRDTTLALSGLLVDKTGGRGVKPFEPPGLWEAVSFNNAQKYVPDTGEGQYRRSLYTYWKRQSPPPNMLLFDAPTREYCVVRRPRTNTPLQALVLMNDPQFVEAARSLAQRIMLEGGSTSESRIAYAFRLATSRSPRADEIQVLSEAFTQQLEAFSKDPESAEKLLKVGAFQAKPEFNRSELAAWTTIASMILNLDETVTKG